MILGVPGDAVRLRAARMEGPISARDELQTLPRVCIMFLIDTISLREVAV
jgi:hypothetical protein